MSLYTLNDALLIDNKENLAVLNAAMQLLYKQADEIRFGEMQQEQEAEIATRNAILELSLVYKLDQFSLEKLKIFFGNCVALSFILDKEAIQQDDIASFTFAEFCIQMVDMLADKIMAYEKKAGITKDGLIKSVVSELKVDIKQNREIIYQTENFEEYEKAYKEIAKDILPDFAKYLDWVEKKLIVKLRKSDKELSDSSKNNFKQLHFLCEQLIKDINELQNDIAKLNAKSMPAVFEKINSMQLNSENVFKKIEECLASYKIDREVRMQISSFRKLFEKFCDKVRRLLHKERYGSTKFVLQEASNNINKKHELLHKQTLFSRKKIKHSNAKELAENLSYGRKR